MFDKLRYSIVVDVGSKNIKILNGRVRRDFIEIYSCSITETPKDAVKNGRIINTEKLARAIKQVIIDNNIRGKKIVFTVSGSEVITSYMEIDNIPKSNIKKIVEREVEAELKLDMSKYVLDYKILREFGTQTSSKYEVFVAVVPAAQAEEYMAVVDLLGLEIEAIDIPANCITKFLFGIPSKTSPKKKLNINNENPILAIDIGATTSGFYIYYEKKLNYNCTVEWGSEHISKLISEKQQIDLQQAEELKKSSYIDMQMQNLDFGDTNSTISKIVSETLNDNIISKIKELMKKYSGENKGNGIRCIYIFGGGSYIGRLDEYLRNTLKINVEYLQSAYTEIRCANISCFDKLSENFEFFVSCVGGLMRG